MILFEEAVNKSKLSNKEIAKELGVSSSQVTQWKYDKRVFISDDGELIRVSVINSDDIKRKLGV